MIPAERELIGLEGELVNSLRTDRLQLILLPTEQCNFRCTYCYEDFAIGRMSDAVVAGVKTPSLGGAGASNAPSFRGVPAR